MAVLLGKAVVVVARLISELDNVLNIIVPVYNEGDQLLPWLQELTRFLKSGDQLVIVDASETDASQLLLSNLVSDNQQVHFLKSAKGRAIQMNAGAEYIIEYHFSKQSSSKLSYDNKPGLLWFLHSDSGLSVEHLNYLRGLSASVYWGRFDVQLTPTIFPFGIISKIINLRSRMTQVMTGDQGVFIRSDVFQLLKGYAQIPLMEDVEITKRLREISKADCDGPVLQTSARRWQQHGWLKTVLLMWQLRLMYWLGVSPETLVKKYYG